jgi:hypothetical protein
VPKQPGRTIWLLILGAVSLVSAVIFTWRHPRFSVYRDKFLCFLPDYWQIVQVSGDQWILLALRQYVATWRPIAGHASAGARASISPTLRAVLKETERDV